MPLFKDMPDRSEAYKKWIRTLQCHVCGSPHTISHHENAQGQSTMGGKTHDSRTVPLCVCCHAERHATGRHWWKNKDPEAIIMAYRILFIKQGGRKFWEGE